MNDNELIKLKNSNALNKYAVDAEQLNFNFQQLLSLGGGTAIKDIIEASGQVYSTTQPDQLLRAIVQLINTAYLFKSSSVTNNKYVLTPYQAGYAEPYRLSYGMRITFITDTVNTDTATIKFSSMQDSQTFPLMRDNLPIQAGVITPNTRYEIIFVKDAENGDHWNIIKTTNASGDADASSVDNILAMLRALVASTGLAYDPTDTTILGKAVAQYVCNSLYESSYQDGTYTLQPYQNQYKVTNLSNGVTFSFIADNANQTNSVNIQLTNGQLIPLKDYNGNNIPVNAIRPTTLITIRYNDGRFYLINQFLSRLVLSNGIGVNEISTDNTFENASDTKIATQRAIKEYVDFKTLSAQSNNIVSGSVDSTGKADALRLSGIHTAQLISNNNDVEYSLLDVTPSDPNAVTSSKGDTHAINAVAGIKDTDLSQEIETGRISSLYWDCAEKAVDDANCPVGGFAIDGCTRVRDAGTGLIQREVNPDGSNSIFPYKMREGRNYSYYQVLAANTHDEVSAKLPDIITLRHTKENSTPNEIKVQFQFTQDGAWYDVVDTESSIEVPGETTVYYWDSTDSVRYYTASAEPEVGTKLYTDTYLSRDSGYAVTNVATGTETYTFEAEKTDSPTITCNNPAAQEIDIRIASVSYNYGVLTNMTPDESKTYTIKLPHKLWDTLNRVELITDYSSLLESATYLRVRICATYFTHQTDINLNTVDPYTGYDTASGTYTERSTWEIAQLKLFKKVESVPQFAMAYPSKMLETLNDSLYFTLYQQAFEYDSDLQREVPQNNVSLPEFTLDPDTLDPSATTAQVDVILYKERVSNVLRYIKSDSVFIQSYAPEASSSYLGCIWFNVETTPFTSYKCTQHVDEEQVVTYSWDPVDLILLGKSTLTVIIEEPGRTKGINPFITNITTYRYGNTYIYNETITAETEQPVIANHNFGFDITTQCYLRCISPEHGYKIGEYVSVGPYRYLEPTLTPATQQITVDGVSYTVLTSGTVFSTSESYFDIVEDYDNTYVRFSNLKILSKGDSPSYVPVSLDKWDLCIYVTKD